MNQKMEIAFKFRPFKNAGRCQNFGGNMNENLYHSLGGSVLDGWSTFFRPHPISKLPIYPSYAKPAASLQSEKSHTATQRPNYLRNHPANHLPNKLVVFESVEGKNIYVYNI